MAFYRGYGNNDADMETVAAPRDMETDYETDQMNADILDSLFADEEEALKEEGESALDDDEGEEDSMDATGQAMDTDPPEPTVLRREQEGTTVITKGTTINGSIISDCSLDVMGTINGDIECLGKLSISGKVVGDSRASEIFVNTDRLEGSIYSEGSVKIAQQTIVIGNVSGTSGVIAGAVKGDVDIAGALIVDSTAVVQGDIKAKSIQLNNGAVLDGRVSLAYATGIDINNIFTAK